MNRRNKSGKRSALSAGKELEETDNRYLWKLPLPEATHGDKKAPKANREIRFWGR